LMAGGLLEIWVSEGAGGNGEDAVKLFGVSVSTRARRAIVKALVEKAMAGDVQATAFLFDRIYGRPGVSEKTSDADGLGKAVIEPSRLDEEEMIIFARLFKKCFVADPRAGSGAAGAVGRRRLAISERASGVRGGGAGPDMVEQANASGEGAADA